MEFFLLFLFNIFTAVVIYLVLSLKIEKSSATFQEKKLRKEMGEIITEFNSTAERNITILENKISILKRLLNEAGNIKGIDMRVFDNGDLPGMKGETKLQTLEEKNTPVERKPSHTKEVIPSNEIISADVSKLRTFEKTEKAKAKATTMTKEERKKSIDFIEDSPIDFLDIYKEEKGSPVGLEDKIEESLEDNISELFAKTKDKYTLINDLYSKGYTVEELSRFSGLPSGEVRLVISLNSKNL
ncbi:MAG TPA: hypothetical protein PKX79_08355 [Spirochaetota bacterium]|jgi:hypothetical protein|nr:hypothetical protein [Spirochaetota bacterium]OQA98925.1 MAG: hypothetical protein BWY23_00856 [Spirochaetes bacterium ADurb.Bin218]HOK03052.1 hypothetical protein [Spirochaetota bacterium]HOQ12951.1 hypothetical protein [Spirochaetota bacterium]HOV08575.1 hypothetical protein [Spirochaetota bacterium]